MMPGLSLESCTPPLTPSPPTLSNPQGYRPGPSPSTAGSLALTFTSLTSRTESVLQQSRNHFRYLGAEGQGQKEQWFSPFCFVPFQSRHIKNQVPVTPSDRRVPTAGSVPPTPAPLQWEGLCAPPATRAGGPAPSSQPCGERVEPFFNEAEVPKDCLLSKLHSSCRSWDPICILLSVLGKPLALSESRSHPRLPLYTPAAVLRVGQKGQEPGKSLRGARQLWHRPRRLLGAQLRAPPRSSGRDPLRSRAPPLRQVPVPTCPLWGTRTPTLRGERAGMLPQRGVRAGTSIWRGTPPAPRIPALT